jgi:hypothetical protein
MQVVGEIIAGVLLGPSVLGRILGEQQQQRCQQPPKQQRQQQQ